MADRFLASQKAVIDSDARNMKLNGYPLSDELNDLWAEIDSGAIGIEADAGDIDSLAKDGGHFAIDQDTTDGLLFALNAGRLLDGQTVVTLGADDVTLSASQTNYVELLYSGGSWALSSNTSGFTAGAVPLYVVVTGASSISTITNRRVLLEAHRDGGILGVLLSTPGKTKEMSLWLGTISATTTFRIVCPSGVEKVSRAGVAVNTTVAANDTNYWTLSGQNKGAAGTGTTDLLAGTDANTSKATGGSAFTANVFRAFTLHGTAANLDTAADDVLTWTFTKTASASDLVGAVLKVEWTFEN